MITRYRLGTVLTVMVGVSRRAAAPAAAVAADSDGEVLAWGLNLHLQLGEKPHVTQREWAAPVCQGQDGCIPAGSAVDVEAGATHSTALLRDGTVRTWGNSRDGRLGNGATGTSSTSGERLPQQVCAVGSTGSGCAPLAGVKEISTSHDHTLAIVGEGGGPATAPTESVVAWGVGGDGRLGNDGIQNTSTPVYACRSTDACTGGVKDVSAGRKHSLALLDDGKVLSWGDNTYQQLGYRTGTGSATHPTQVPICPAGEKPCEVTDIAAGADHSAAVTADGRVFTWGRNQLGQLGHHLGSAASRTTPAAVENLGGKAKAVAAGESHTVVLLADNTLVAWGDASRGQLGGGVTRFSDGTTSQHAPTPVCGTQRPRDCDEGKLGDLQEIDANGDYTLALSTGGTVYAWGANGSGQLGDGTTGSHAYPLVPRGRLGPQLTGVTRISAGAEHALAVHAPGAYARPVTDEDHGGQGWRLRLAHGQQKCAEVPGAAAGSGTGVTQKTCEDSTVEQRFVLKKDPDGYYEIRLLRDRSKCLDVQDSAQGEAPLIAYSCHGGLNQRFHLVPDSQGYYHLKALHSGNCLGVADAGEADGAAITQQSCQRKGNLWEFA